jgi:hypothetical protein
MSPEVAESLKAARAAALEALSAQSGRELLVEPDPSLPPGGWNIEAARAP